MGEGPGLAVLALPRWSCAIVGFDIDLDLDIDWG